MTYFWVGAKNVVWFEKTMQTWPPLPTLVALDKIKNTLHPECFTELWDVRLTWIFLGSVGTGLRPIRNRTRRSRSCRFLKSSFSRRTWGERWLHCAAQGTAQRKLPGIPSRRSSSTTCTGRCPPRHPWWTHSGALLDGRLQGTSCRLKLWGDPLPSDTGSLPVTQENSNYPLSEHAELDLKKKWVKTNANKLSLSVYAIKTRSSLLVQRCVRANRPITSCHRGHGSDVNKRLDRGDPWCPTRSNTQK